MAYLVLILEHDDRREWSDEKAIHASESMTRFGNDLAKRGILRASSSLRPPSEAVRIQVRSGKRTVLDGPFAEAKEIVGGFLLLDCASREDAIAIASECPAAAWATVEVREVADTCLRDDLRGRR